MAGANPQLVVKILANTAELIANLNAGRGAIEQYGPSIAKMQDTWNRHGAEIIQQAALITAALKDIHVGTLTAADSAKALKQLEAGMAQLRATGQPIPALMQETADKLRAVATSKAPGFFGDLTTQIKATALGFISAQAIIGTAKMAYRELAQFVGDSVKAYANAEAAQKKMTTALTAAGRAAPETITQFNNLAKTFQNTTVYGDDLITEMQALLVQIGNVMPRDMEKALTASTNLASGLGIDLETATKLVGKAFAGETGTLKRYGIVIDEAKLSAEGMPAVLDAIQSRFGGQAQAEIETYTGKVKQLENAWDDLQEAVGEVIVTDTFLQAALRKVTETITGQNEAAAGGKKSLIDWWIALTGGFNQAEANIGLKMLEDYLRTTQSVNAQMVAMRAKLKAPDITPNRPNQFGTDAAAIAAAQQQAWIDEPKQIKAAEDALKKFRAEEKAFTAQSDALIASREKYATVMRTNTDLLTKAMRGSVDAKVAQADLNSALHDGAAVWLRQQEVMTPVALKTLPGIVIELDKLKTKLPTVAASLKTNLMDVFERIPQTLVNAFTGGGDLKGAASAMGSMLGGTIGKSIGAGIKALGKFGGPIGEALGALAGPLMEKLFSMFGNATKSAINQAFGSYDQLREELNTLTGAAKEAGDALWIQLTQRTGKNDTNTAARLIQEINALLAEQKTKQEELAAVTVITSEAEAQATIETAAAAAVALDQLNDRLAVNAEAWGTWSEDVTGFLQKLADDIRAMPLPGPGGVVEGSGARYSGGGPTVREQQPVLVMAGGDGGGYAPLSVNIDGESAWSGLVRVAKRNGLG